MAKNSKLTGIYENIQIEDYHSGPGLSCSEIKELSRGPEYYKYYLETRIVERRITQSMEFGRFAHCAVLEPELLSDHFVVPPDSMPTKRSNEGKKVWLEFEEKNKNKNIITKEEFRNFTQMIDVIWGNDVVSRLLQGEKERSVYVTKENILCKCRPDIICSDYIVDLKFVRDSSQHEFMKQCGYLKYYIQAAYYLDICRNFRKNIKNFIFIAVEKEPPFVTKVYTLSDSSLANGRLMYEEGIRKYNDYISVSLTGKKQETQIQELNVIDWSVESV